LCLAELQSIGLVSQRDFRMAQLWHSNVLHLIVLGKKIVVTFTCIPELISEFEALIHIVHTILVHLLLVVISDVEGKLAHLSTRRVVLGWLITLIKQARR
jgi:hypothetical protein